MAYSTTPIKGKSIKNLGLFIGCWEGTMDDDLVEEHWMSAAHGNMTGMFRWMKNGDVYIYEIMALIEKDGEIHLLLRHFDRNFNSMEERDEPIVYQLTEVEDTRAVFIRKEGKSRGFKVYELMGVDYLKFSDINADGSVKSELIFKRQPRG